MNSFNIKIGILVFLLGCFQLLSAQKGQIGLGYDNGMALRYFFQDNMSFQTNISLEILGSRTDVANNNETEIPVEYNFGAGSGLLYNLFDSKFVFLDALAQIAYAHDGGPSEESRYDQDNLFFILALVPEFLAGEHLGLGLKLGFEVARMGKVTRITGNNQTTDRGAFTNIRFFGPANPFNGPVLGFSVYVYFGGS